MVQDLDARFDELFAQVDTSEGFHHRDHVELTWLAVRRYGVADATELIRHGIQKLARYANAPQKYHETVSRAWVVVVALHVGQHPDPDFDTFIERSRTKWKGPRDTSPRAQVFGKRIGDLDFARSSLFGRALRAQPSVND